MVLRTPLTKSAFSGGWKWDRRIFSEEVPREIAISPVAKEILRLLRTATGEFFLGSISRNREFSGLSPFGDYKIKGEDGGTGESRSRQILPLKKSPVAFQATGNFQRRPEIVDFAWDFLA